MKYRKILFYFILFFSVSVKALDPTGEELQKEINIGEALKLGFHPSLNKGDRGLSELSVKFPNLINNASVSFITSELLSNKGSITLAVMPRHTDSQGNNIVTVKINPKIVSKVKVTAYTSRHNEYVFTINVSAL
jgi:hypothetical protein